MSHYTQRYQRGTMGPQARRGDQENRKGRFLPAHLDDLHAEIQRLSRLLDMERARRFEENQRLADLEEEMEQMKLQMERQTDVKEALISQAENAKRELERIERYSDPEIIKAVIIASEAYRDINDLNKKSFQQKYVDLMVAHLLSQEAFVAEIQDERKKSQALQEELDQLQTSYEELSSEYEADDDLGSQEAETQTDHEAKLSEERQLLENLRAEKDEMFKEMSQQITVLQDSEKHLREELNQLRHSYDELNRNYDSDVSLLKQNVERYQEELRNENEANLERETENLSLINQLRAEKEELFQKLSGENTILQTREKEILNELNQVHISYEELKHRYEKDTEDLKKQVATYQQERKAQLEKAEEDKAILEKLRAEYEVLQENTTEIKILLEKEKSVQAELEEVKGLYQELNCRHKTEVTAMKKQAEQYQQEIRCVKNDLETARNDFLLADSLRAQEDDLQQKHKTVSKEMEEDSKNQEDLEKVSSPEVSTEEELSEELSGCSSDPGPSVETATTEETVLEHLDHPDIEPMKDGKKKKSKISFWKKIRNLLRFKKPQKKQKNEDDLEHP